MKEIVISILSVILLALFFYSCSFNTSLMVERPAKLTLPKKVKKVLVVDRTLTGKRNYQKMIEAGGFMEVKGLSKTTLFTYLLAEIGSNDRLETAHPAVLTFVELRKWGESKKDLSPYVVDSLCETHGADAIIALERYTNYSTSLGDDIFNRMREVRAEWKFYDTHSGNVVNHHDYYNNTASINNRNDYHTVPLKFNRNKTLSAITAIDYIRHIAPHKVQEKRRIFKADNKSMKMAEHYFDAKDYTSAREIYESCLENDDIDRKVSGRLYYNIAVTHEVEGNKDEALKFAEFSKERGCSRATSYVVNLRNQISNESIIDLQKEGN